MRSIVSLAIAVLLTSTGAAQAPIEPGVISSGKCVGPVSFLRFSPNGQELARICAFGPVELIDLAGFRRARTFSIGMRMVAYSPDGARIATAEGTDGARIWDAGAPGRRIDAAGTAMDELSLIDVALKVLQTPSRDAALRVFWAAFSPDGGQLMTTQANGRVTVWSTSSWVVEGELTLTASEVRGAAFTSDGREIIFGDADGVVHEWSVENRAEVRRTRAAQGAIGAVVLGPANDMLVTTHRGNTVTLWDGAREMPDVRTGFVSAAFSNDGRLLALGGSHVAFIDPASREQIRIIESPETTQRQSGPPIGTQATTGSVPPIIVSALAFSPDGRTLAIGYVDGRVRLVSTNP